MRPKRGNLQCFFPPVFFFFFRTSQVVPGSFHDCLCHTQTQRQTFDRVLPSTYQDTHAGVELVDGCPRHEVVTVVCMFLSPTWCTADCHECKVRNPLVYSTALPRQNPACQNASRCLLVGMSASGK
ncbi:hypothetical protein CaCOL14_012908 [Colletotrichum acutatum]|uniref:Uncharacterized protein n=1 Tax=Glomerella acutata TaxID=27357 RepID=A0AAD8UG57_GLOAC|nr:uncharacterized protein BDZ83DRAFT_636220 [Colletotrichum acutatum]KAK1714952.1 hypothetical protein BDZ83DRAFT_636220 [Colletotrichum acutatum]